MYTKMFREAIFMSFFKNRHSVWGNFKFSFVIFWIEQNLEVSDEAYSFKRGKQTIYCAFLFEKASSWQNHSKTNFWAPVPGIVLHGGQTAVDTGKIPALQSLHSRGVIYTKVTRIIYSMLDGGSC